MMDFELAPLTKEVVEMMRACNVNVVRELSRHYDQYEHEHDDMPEDQLAPLRENVMAITAKSMSGEKPSEGRGLTQVIMAEERAWGANIFGGAATRMGLGNSAIMAVGTPEQKARFNKLYCAMAITEPSCGSDTAAIRATAKLDPATNEWILNGEKIFVTAGKVCEAVVVWASPDRSKGRPAIKSFVVEKDRPGITVTKLENKLGIRASDTASIVLEDCRSFSPLQAG